MPDTSTLTVPLTRSLARRIVATAAAAILLAVAAPALSASAASTGWLRVAHLSPDTAHVNVSVVALSGNAPKVKLDDVAYGAVSKYMALPQGTYAVAMTPAGGGSTPVVQTSVHVQAGKASTIAVIGRNAALKTHVFTDDLSTPPSGSARVRLVQAATTVQRVTVTTSTGRAIASSAAVGTATPYSTVPARAWTLSLTGGGRTTHSTVTLKNGSVVTLFVLDTAGNGITLKTVVDSASVGALPKGFLATGGGFLAHQARSQALMLQSGGALVVLAAIAAIVLRRRLRRV